MNIRDYLLAALKADSFAKRDWLISILAVTTLPEAPVENYPYELYQLDGKYCFNDPELDGVPTVLVGSDITKPLVSVKQAIVIAPGEIPGLTVSAKGIKDFTTTVGNLLFNYATIIKPFGGKIPFQIGKVNLDALEKLIASKVEDEPADGNRKPDCIYWDELQLYVKYGMACAGLEVFCVPAASKRGLLPHPEAAALRKRLIAERQGRLHDPAVIAEIAKELEALDREWINGDPDKGYYIKAKAFQVTRMRTFGIYGAEKDLVNGGVAFIEKPLLEGYDPETLPVAITSSRDGSFSRGAMTALGGDQVKKMLRTMSGVEITSEDCGSKVGIPTLITEKFVGHSVLVNGKVISLSNDNIGSFVNRWAIRRSPMACKEAPNNYCMCCVGEFIRDRRDAVGLVVSEVGSKMMLVKMSAMHGKALKTNTYNYLEDIS